MSAPLVLFDLDGVLLDSRTAIARSINAALAEHGLPPRPETELHGYIGPPLRKAFLALGAGSLTDACIDAYRRRYRIHSAQETVVADGIPELLPALASANMLVIATSKPQALAAPLVTALGLGAYFDAVVGPSLEATAETKGETIERALAGCQDAAAPVMIGDRRHDIAGAHANGLPGIGVLWGIGDEIELTGAGAAAIAREPAELPRLIEQLRG